MTWALNCLPNSLMANDGEMFTFMNMETYEQIELPKDTLGSLPKYVKESDVCQVLLHEGKPLTVEPPFTVELTVAQTDPGVRGDTNCSSTWGYNAWNSAIWVHSQ